MASVAAAAGHGDKLDVIIIALECELLLKEVIGAGEAGAASSCIVTLDH